MATTKINGIPVFRATLISDKCGMKKISLVDAPAVQADFLAFAEGEQPMRYAVQDEDKHLVYGVIMRADYPIYRYSKQTGEYYIMYSPETIRDMAEKYLIEGRQNDVNLQHEEGSDVEGVNLVQFFIKDTEKGVSPAGFEDIENGSLFGEFHCTNEEVWAGIKDGTYKGFSLEGIFGTEAVHEVISTEKMAVNSKKNIAMKIMEIVRGAIATALENVEQSEEYKTADEQANEEAKDETPAAFGSVATDKGVMRWDGDAALEVGNAVRMVAEDGSESVASDGMYATESHTIEVAGGIVKGITEIEIKAAEEEAAPAAEAAAEEVKAEQEEKPDTFAEIMQKMAASFNDKYRAIYDALYAAGVGAYIVEAGDTFAVVEYFASEKQHFYRYALSFGEDNAVTLGERVEVFPVFATAEEKAEIESKYAAQDAELAQVKAELEKMKAAPAAEAAHEQFKAYEGPKEMTGEERLDNISRILGAK